MTKHTKGPWFVSSYDEIETELAVTIDGYTICLLDQSYFDRALPRKETEANARLIAAAPELLGALKNLRDNFDYPPAAYEIILKAIAKAEGGAE